jgi:predicted dithiol-disulfide oxidoreductase (DUF899 family)
MRAPAHIATEPDYLQVGIRICKQTLLCTGRPGTFEGWLIDELARRRQDLPWVRLDTDYRFETDEGSASLKDLFRGRSQLLVYHFMFGPDYEAGCPSCSAIADGFVVHLANHDVTLSAVSLAPLAKLQAFRRRMGWSFPWASSLGGNFNFDFNV